MFASASLRIFPPALRCGPENCGSHFAAPRTWRPSCSKSRRRWPTTGSLECISARIWFVPYYRLKLRNLRPRRRGAAASIVEAGSAGVGVAGEALDVFERHALGEQVGDDGAAERVRRELGGAGKHP